jgi:predicted transcriptional regulator
MQKTNLGVFMKKLLVFCLVGCMFYGLPVSAEELKVGMKASDWSFKDADDKVFTMASWEGKVLVVNYVDPDESDLNDHFTDALKKAKDEGLLSPDTYKGIGIADCAATWKPNFAIRAIAGQKAKKYNSTILFDYDASLRNAWGLGKDTANAIVLDKKRICRAIVRGRVPDDQVASLVQLVIDLQGE